MAKSKKSEYLELKKTELATMAKELGLAGTSKLTKDELIDDIIKAERSAKLKATRAKQSKSAKPLKAAFLKPAEKKKTEKKKEQPAGKASSKAAKPAKQKAVRSKKSALSNGTAIQHPSASPSALRYSRYSEDEERAVAAVWPDRGSIPDKYGRDRLVLLARDPGNLFCMWEISHEKLESLSKTMPEEKWLARRQVLRLFRTTAGMSKPIAEVGIYGEAGRYHIEVPYPNATYHVEIGFYFPDGAFECVLSGAPMRTPQDSPPTLSPVRWMTVSPVRQRRTLTLKTQPAANGSVKAGKMRRDIESAVADRRRELGISDSPAPSSDERAGQGDGTGNALAQDKFTESK